MEFKTSANFSLEDSIKHADLEKLATLIGDNSKFLEKSSSKRYRSKLFKLAVEHGQTSVVDLLLKKININLDSNDNEFILLASTDGHTDIVKMLLERPGVNPGANDDEAIIMASKNGHIDIVRLLFERNEVNPAAEDNEAVMLFAKLKRHAFPKLLYSFLDIRTYLDSH